ncbi:hypothetical protein BKA63DRAFT_497632 [Paraphoma chrysanthemicola]|nr:hypothetical protein BKA63DRAFT_497632 [Paraphoma chrysanthemicola]
MSPWASGSQVPPSSVLILAFADQIKYSNRAQANLKDKVRTLAVNMIQYVPPKSKVYKSRCGTGLKNGFEDVNQRHAKDGRKIIANGETALGRGCTEPPEETHTAESPECRRLLDRVVQQVLSSSYRAQTHVLVAPSKKCAKLPTNSAALATVLSSIADARSAGVVGVPQACVFDNGYAPALSIHDGVSRPLRSIKQALRGLGGAVIMSQLPCRWDAYGDASSIAAASGTGAAQGCRRGALAVTVMSETPPQDQNSRPTTTFTSQRSNP